MRRICGALVLLLTCVVTSLYAQTIYWTGTITTAGADCSVTTRCMMITDLREVPSLGVYLDVGTSGTFNFEATIDGSTWFAVTDDVGAASSATVDGAYFFKNPGYRSFRIRASAIVGTATLSVSRGLEGLRSTATISGTSGDGSIVDGATPAIKATVLNLAGAKPLTAAIVDATGAQISSFGGGTQYTQDAALTVASTIGTMAFGRASAAAPTDVSADNDAVLPWYLRSGAMVQQPSYAGSLAAVNAGNASAATPRVVMATDQPAMVGLGIYTEDSPETGNGNLSMAGSVRRDTAASSAGTTGDNATLNTDANGKLWVNGEITVALPAGTNAIGKLAANSGVIIGDVNVVSSIPGVGATSLGKAEDAAHTTGDTLVGIATKRTDTAASSAGTDGDYATLNTDATGRLWANTELPDASALADATANPTLPGVASFRMCWNGSTWDRCVTPTTTTHDAAMTAGSTIGNTPIFIAKDQDGAALPNLVSAEGDGVIPAASLYGVQYVMAVNEDGSTVGHIICDTGCGAGTQYVEDAAETAGSQLSMAGTVRRDTAASSAGTTGDNATLNTDSVGALWVNPFSQTQAAATYLTVRLSDGSSFVTPGTDYTHDAALTTASTAGPMQMGRASDAAPTNVSASDDAVLAWYLRNGSAVTNIAAGGTLITSTSTSLNTNVTNSTLAVTQSGTWTVQPGNTANTTAWLVAGGKTNNNAAPGATNFGVLPALANASAPTWSEGNLVALSTDLAGALRIAGAISCSNCTGSGASKVDDAAFGVATDSVAPTGGMFDDVAPDSVNEGDVGIVRMSGNRNLYVNLRDNAGNERGLNIDASGNLNVTTVSTVTAVTAITNALPTGTNSIGKVDVNGGTVAHDAVGTGVNPLLQGAYASQAAPTDVSADGDAVRVWALRNGAQVVNLSAGGTLITSTGANLNVQCANCSGSGATGVDDAAFSIATDSVAPAGFLFDDVATDSVNEGDVGLGRMSANRVQYVMIRDNSGNERGLDIDANGKLGAVANLTLINGNAVNTTNGVNGSGTIRVTLASDSTGNIATIGTSVTPGTAAANLGKAEDAAHTTGDTLVGVATKRTDTAASSAGTDGDYATLNTDANGKLWANSDLTAIAGTAISVNAGAVGAGVIRTTIANDSPGIIQDDAAFTVGSTYVRAAGFVADESSTDSVNEDDLGAARMTLDRVLWASPAAVTASTQATVGCYLVSAASTNSTSCKGSAGNLYGIRVVNTTGTLYYLRLYNTAAAPTCSSATGFIESIPIPASATGAGIVWAPTYPINYSTGIGYCFTGGSSSTDNTNAATGVFGAIQYK
jgi:hypothetical protein